MNPNSNTTETTSTTPKTSEELSMGDLDAVRAALDDPDFIWVL